MKLITLVIAGALLVSIHAENELQRRMAAFEIATSLLCDKTLDKEQYQACVGAVADEMDVNVDDLVAFRRAHDERIGEIDAEAI